ncbi:MAG: Gfo/Idh/MocA family protein [Alsobacter sp.]
MTAQTLDIAVIGVGVIGGRHARLCAASAECRLCAIVDENPASARLAAELGAAFYPNLDAMLDHERPHGVVVATPTPSHEAIGLAAIAAGAHLLVEKPIAVDLPAAARLVEAAAKRGVRILVGHHRRHNPIGAEARRIVADGEIGRLLAVNVLWAVLKPRDYFDIAWRTQTGAGPVMTNLIHEVDLLRFICGEIAFVSAATGHFGRGLAVEDTAAALLRFENGALGTITASDAAPSPWSWDANTGENPTIAISRGNFARYLGSEGSLEFPDLQIWRYAHGRETGWNQPLLRESRLQPMADAYQCQLAHFCAVIRGEAEPLSSGEDASRTLAATVAILQSAVSGHAVDLIPPVVARA